MIDDGCTTEGCSLSQYQKDQDAQKLMLLEKENYKRNCEAGNENYCPTVETHPAEVIGFVSAGLIAGPFVENFILGGGAATTADVTTLALKSVYDKALYTCLLSNICSRLFGLGHQEQLTSNQIGDWGEQQVSDQLPVDVRQFRIPDPITGQVRIYDGQLISDPNTYVEVKTSLRGVVYASEFIRNQILFDTNMAPKPMWIFVNSRPSGPLIYLLQQSGIPWHSLHP